jgi:hypothetical protein
MTSAAGALERAIADACLGRRAGEDLTADLGTFLGQRAVPAADVAAAMSAPQRLAVYRSLVRNGLSSVVLLMLPRTRARMNAACGGRFDADFATFVDQVGPRTHYLRDVPAELVAWASPRWRGDPSVPGYLPDLASYELAHFTVSASEAAASPNEVAEVAVDRPVAFSGSTRLLRCAWAVHTLADDDGLGALPEERRVELLAYRNADHAVRWLELTPLAASIIARLQNMEPLGQAIASACTEVGTAREAVLPDVARLLSDLGQRGVLLGGESA